MFRFVQIEVYFVIMCIDVNGIFVTFFLLQVIQVVTSHQSFLVAFHLLHIHRFVTILIGNNFGFLEFVRNDKTASIFQQTSLYHTSPIILSILAFTLHPFTFKNTNFLFINAEKQSFYK